MKSHRAAEAPVQAHNHTANGPIDVEVCGNIRRWRSILMAGRFGAAPHVQRFAGDDIRPSGGHNDDAPGDLFGTTEAWQPGKTPVRFVCTMAGHSASGCALHVWSVWSPTMPCRSMGILSYLPLILTGDSA